MHKTSLANEFSKTKRKPVFLHMKTVRLLGHAGSDIEVGYKALNEIETIEFNDPLLHTARIMIDKKLLSKEDIISIYENSRMRVSQVFDQACTRPKLNNSKNVMKSITASNIKRKAPSLPDEAKRRGVFDKEYQRLNNKNHMAGLINYALSDILLRYSNTVIFGEDVGKNTINKVLKYENSSIVNKIFKECRFSLSVEFMLAPGVDWFPFLVACKSVFCVS